MDFVASLIEVVVTACVTLIVANRFSLQKKLKGKIEIYKEWYQPFDESQLCPEGNQAKEALRSSIDRDALELAEGNPGKIAVIVSVFVLLAVAVLQILSLFGLELATQVVSVVTIFLTLVGFIILACVAVPDALRALRKQKNKKAKSRGEAEDSKSD